MFEIVDNHSDEAIIKVVGVGGGGGNAVEHMVAQTIEGVEFICLNTDAQALRKSSAGTTIQLGKSVTKGLGAGANPEVGREAALEDKETIRQAIAGSDMVFIAAGMGGGTGTGAAPVVAEVAKEEGILTVAVVTKPFGFEGKKRASYADQGIQQLADNVDSLITVPNEKLMKVLGGKTPLMEAFKAADNVLFGAVQGIAELITNPGYMNADFADVRTVMGEMGNAMMGTGIGKGDNRAEDAAEAAVASPLLEDIDLAGAKGVLVNITAGMDITLDEFESIGNHVRHYASDSATVVVGMVMDLDMSDEVRVTVVATGIGADKKPDILLDPKQKIADSRPQLRTAYSSEGASQHHAVEPTRSSEPLEASRSAMGGQAAPANKPKETQKNDYLDIPAFLRRQAD